LAAPSKTPPKQGIINEAAGDDGEYAAVCEISKTNQRHHRAALLMADQKNSPFSDHEVLSVSNAKSKPGARIDQVIKRASRCHSARRKFQLGRHE